MPWSKRSSAQPRPARSGTARFSSNRWIRSCAFVRARPIETLSENQWPGAQGPGIDAVCRLATYGLTVDRIGPLDLRLAGGHIACLHGPSGAGKSRLLRAVADLDDHRGECQLDGRAQHTISAPEWRRAVGLLPAESRWWGDSINAHLPDARDSALHGSAGTPANAPETHALAAALDLSADILTQPIEQLSSGQRQRGALLRLLAHRPRVLLLDEPTANLDADNIARVEHLLCTYVRDTGASALWVSHDHAQRRRVADDELAIDAAGRVSSCS